MYGEAMCGKRNQIFHIKGHRPCSSNTDSPYATRLFVIFPKLLKIVVLDCNVLHANPFSLAINIRSEAVDGRFNAFPSVLCQMQRSTNIKPNTQ